MKSYKSKDNVSLYIFLILAIFLVGVDVYFCCHMCSLGLEQIKKELLEAVLSLVTLFSFTGLIIFWLLNANPIRINVFDDCYEFVYVCRNKIKVKVKDIKVVSGDYVDDGWYVILYMRKRFTRVSSDEFPKLKELMDLRKK